MKRVIAHPSFHNVGYKECEKLCDELGEGECVIRPSSKVCGDVEMCLCRAVMFPFHKLLEYFNL